MREHTFQVTCGQSENYELRKQQDGGSAEHLSLCMHGLLAPAEQPTSK